MSRTQDLALARLRLVSRRWQGQGTATQSPALLGGSPSRQDPAELRARCPSARLGGEQPRQVAGDPESEQPARTPGSVWVGLLALLVVVAAVGAGAALLISRPRHAPGAVVGVSVSRAAEDPFAAPTGDAGESPPPARRAAPSPTASLLVHVTGDVRRPGVVRLPTGSRVADALRAAGGLRRGGSVGGTNLARLLVDGERIDVGADVDGAGSGPSGAVGADPGPVDLNTATAEQLDTLPGVGPVTADKILAWRAANGRFTMIEELAEVPGIGPKTLAELRPHVRV